MDFDCLRDQIKAEMHNQIKPRENDGEVELIIKRLSMNLDHSVGVGASGLLGKTIESKNNEDLHELDEYFISDCVNENMHKIQSAVLQYIDWDKSQADSLSPSIKELVPQELV